MSMTESSLNNSTMHCDMDSQDIHHALETARLELEYERALRQAERICEEERARALRVQLLLLEDENYEAHEDLEGNEHDLQKLEDQNQELRDQIADIDEQYQATQIDLKACMRDIDHLHTEIDSLNASNTDATKVLTEKLALSRELAVLRPELEHFKAQSKVQENLLADKLALERELNAIQVDLETEKRTVQRLKSRSNSADNGLNDEIEELRKELAKERKSLQKLEREKKSKHTSDKITADAALSEEIEELRKQLEEERGKVSKITAENRKQSSKKDESTEEMEELRKELVKEKKNMQKIERENLKKSTEWDSQKEGLESKLEAFRVKLRSTKEQLKEAQEEIERRDASKFAESTAATKARLNASNTLTSTSQNPKKRNVARFDPDMTIGTPGHGGPGAAKKARLTASSMGDKSTFSITPFLNRTTSILPEETPGKDEHEEASHTLQDQAITTTGECEAGAVTIKPAPTNKKKSTATATASRKRATQPLTESTKSRANAVLKKPSSLDKVLEEDEDVASSNQNAIVTKKLNFDDAKTTDEPTQKKARKNIFDESDAEENTNSTSIGGAGKRKLFGLGRAGSAAGNKMNLGMSKLGSGKPKMLAEFSPLKKDRRPGMNASILA